MNTFYKLNCFLACFFAFQSRVIAIESITSEVRCQIQAENEKNLRKGDFGIITNKTKLQLDFEKFYNSESRQKNRLYYLENSNLAKIKYKNSTIDLPEIFLKSLKNNIQVALDRKYGEKIIYSDLGHAHIYLPNSGPLVISPETLISPKLKFLFHTAELMQLKDGFGSNSKLIDDLWLQWRYFSRNFVGLNLNTDNLAVLFSESQGYNTVRSIDQYTEVGIIYFNANKKACLPIIQDGQTIFFDISFEL